MSEFKGQLGNYKIVRTGDDSPTLWSEFFDENCHSTAGAYSESVMNYVESCNLASRPQGQLFTVLEVGFGLGMGLKATVQAGQLSTTAPIHFVSLELDSALIDWAKENLRIEGLDLSKLKRQDQVFHAEYPEQGLIIDILIGDARTTLPQWHGPTFDAIYQDPFSPKKNPSLWSVEWFEVLRAKSSHNVVMATYCASVAIRKSMLQAGWHPEVHQGFGPKRERTLAKLVGPGDEKLERRLQASAALALRDQAE